MTIKTICEIAVVLTLCLVQYEDYTAKRAEK